MIFHGVYPALITPFFEDGRLDFGALEQHIEFLISKGVHGLFPLGTTGEGLLLSRSERKEVAEQVMKFVNKRIPVVFHVGELSTEGTIELARHAEKIGADGISAVCPYFFPVDDEAIYQHYRRISQSVSEDFPVFLYNIPGNARNEVSLEVLLKLSQNTSNIRSIKISSADFTQIQQILANVPKDFAVVLGPDQYGVAGLQMGAKGNVSGHANVYPEPFVKLYELFMQGEFDKAKEMQQQIYQIIEIFKNGTNLSYFKQALEFRGLPSSFVRSPLRNITKEEKEELFKKLESISL